MWVWVRDIVCVCTLFPCTCVYFCCLLFSFFFPFHFSFILYTPVYQTIDCFVIHFKDVRAQPMELSLLEKLAPSLPAFLSIVVVTSAVTTGILWTFLRHWLPSEWAARRLEWRRTTASCSVRTTEITCRDSRHCSRLHEDDANWKETPSARQTHSTDFSPCEEERQRHQVRSELHF